MAVHPENQKARVLGGSQFKCLYCLKQKHMGEMDPRQRRACCKGCSPEHPEERYLGPWRVDKEGNPRPAPELVI